jgi:hypothetical protein
MLAFCGYPNEDCMEFFETHVGLEVLEINVLSVWYPIEVAGWDVEPS